MVRIIFLQDEVLQKHTLYERWLGTLSNSESIIQFGNNAENLQQDWTFLEKW
jgi:hypothetical protein